MNLPPVTQNNQFVKVSDTTREQPGIPTATELDLQLQTTGLPDLPVPTEGFNLGTDFPILGTDLPLPAGTDFPLPAGTDFPLPAGTDLPLPLGTEFSLPAGTELQLPIGTDLPLPAGTELPLPVGTDVPNLATNFPSAINPAVTQGFEFDLTTRDNNIQSDRPSNLITSDINFPQATTQGFNIEKDLTYPSLDTTLQSEVIDRTTSIDPVRESTEAVSEEMIASTQPAGITTIGNSAKPTELDLDIKSTEAVTQPNVELTTKNDWEEKIDFDLGMEITFPVAAETTTEKVTQMISDLNITTMDPETAAKMLTTEAGTIQETEAVTSRETSATTSPTSQGPKAISQTTNASTSPTSAQKTTQSTSETRETTSQSTTSQPVKPSPVDISSITPDFISSTETCFNWDPVLKADNYELRLSSFTNFDIRYSKTTSNNNLCFEDLQANSQYQLTFQAFNQNLFSDLTFYSFTQPEIVNQDQLIESTTGRPRDLIIGESSTLTAAGATSSTTQTTTNSDLLNEGQQFLTAMLDWHKFTYNEWITAINNYIPYLQDNLPDNQKNLAHPNVVCPIQKSIPARCTEINEIQDHNNCNFKFCTAVSEEVLSQEDVEFWNQSYEIYKEYLYPEYVKLFDKFVLAMENLEMAEANQNLPEERERETVTTSQL